MAKVLEISSKYLYGASIDGSNVITSINSKYNNYVANASGTPLYSNKNGFFTDASEALVVSSFAQTDFLRSDFTVQFWSKIPTANTGLRVLFQFGNNAQL